MRKLGVAWLNDGLINMSRSPTRLKTKKKKKNSVVVSFLNVSVFQRKASSECLS